MYALAPRLTAGLISDYVAGRLDSREAARIEEIVSQHAALAAAVAAARHVDSRMARFFSHRGP